jgi:sugar diacid utilization regulator
MNFSSETIYLIAMYSFVKIMWQEHKRETRFTSQCPPKEIISKIAEAARPLGFDIQKKNYKVFIVLTVYMCIFLQK